MSRIKTHVRKGDKVTVISGNHKGSSGAILQVFPAKSQVIVEGVHMIKKHQRKTQKSPEGGIISREGPIHISNVRLVETAAAAAAAKTPARKTSRKKQR
jgi:large subunit ribosomal protein L24